MIEKSASQKLNPFHIRVATPADSVAISNLCRQLGYSVSPAQVEQRLALIQNQVNHAIFVAQLPNQKLAGWIHIYSHPSLLAEHQAEIGGLVVDVHCRQCGIGQKLIQAAQNWAKKQGCTNIIVRSNMVRKEAHLFYIKAGYKISKTQLVFSRNL
jgi:N-acetylglutamate synthase-like GNAT family acetyltransferase